MTQRIFRRHFNIHRKDSVRSRNIVQLWLRNFRETAFAPKIKRPGKEPSLRTPENIERLRQALSEALRLRECADDKGHHLTGTVLRK